MKIKLLLAAMTFSAAFVLVHAEPPVGADLTGQVILPAGNSGEATVLIRYAELKTNFESSISTRNPLLPKRTRTDRDGHFKIESLDARWRYFGEVMAPGCKLKQMGQIDPAAGPMKISLEAADANLPSNRVIHGKVLDAQGNPVAGALIEIEGTTRKGQTTHPGYDIEYFSVSDDAGNFVVVGSQPFVAADGKVEATGYAEASFEQWPSDAINQAWSRTGSMPEGLMGYAQPLHQITLVTGATLRGRLVRRGIPVAEAEIRLNQCGVGSDCWFWDSAVLTDAEGRFLFAHLPPQKDWSVCGSWDLCAKAGVVPQTEVKIGENGSLKDLGDVELQTVTRVAGRIRLSDGKPLPVQSHFFLSDAAMGRSAPSAFGADGSFQFSAVPGDKVSIFLRVPGYQLTPRDSRLISGSVTNVTIAHNLTNLVIELKPVTSTKREFTEPIRPLNP